MKDKGTIPASRSYMVLLIQLRTVQSCLLPINAHYCPLHLATDHYSLLFP